MLSLRVTLKDLCTVCVCISYEKTGHFLKSLIAHWCGLRLGLYMSLPPERTLARRSKAPYSDQMKMTRPDHSVWNHYHTLLQAGLLDMTTLNSYPCVKSLLEVVLICSEKKKFIENRRRSQQWELPWCYRYRGVWIFKHLRDEQYIVIYLFVPLHTLQWLNDLRSSSLWMELLFNSHSWQASLKCCSLGQFPVIPDFSDTECWAN